MISESDCPLLISTRWKAPFFGSGVQIGTQTHDSMHGKIQSLVLKVLDSPTFGSHNPNLVGLDSSSQDAWLPYHVYTCIYTYRERESYIYKYIQTRIKAVQPAFVQFVRLVFLECQQEINKRLPPVDSFKKKRPAKQPSGTGVLSLEPVNQVGFGRVGIVALKNF